jgi:hypothetical protein
MVAVAVSASTMAGERNRARMIGLVAGSFGAGAALANTIRDRADHRRNKNQKESA